MISFAPYFVEYGFYVANHGGTFKAVMSQKDTFAPDLKALEAAISEKTRVVLINSPLNPTRRDLQPQGPHGPGKPAGKQEPGIRRPIWLVADEPYRFLAYDGAEVPSVLPLYPYAVCISSFSKNLSLPGERVAMWPFRPGCGKKPSSWPA